MLISKYPTSRGPQLCTVYSKTAMGSTISHAGSGRSDVFISKQSPEGLGLELLELPLFCYPFRLQVLIRQPPGKKSYRFCTLGCGYEGILGGLRVIVDTCVPILYNSLM